jgi:phosphoglycolate phosphatase
MRTRVTGFGGKRTATGNINHRLTKGSGKNMLRSLGVWRSILTAMKYSNILFDLDGTLTDSCLGITNSIKYSLGKFDIIEKDDNKLKLFIGPPLENSFAEHYNFSKDDSKIAANYYREYFSEKGIYENKLYDGIDAVLQELNNRSKQCIMATSKPEEFAKLIARHFNLQGYFKYIVGSNPEGTLSEKWEIIKYTIENYKLNKEETIMIGDRKYDIIGAKKNGIDSVGVLYGYGSREELEKEEPKYFCKNVMEIVKIIL